MPNPHYNYYPPAGQVIDANDSSVTWNGRAWMKGGRAYGVPSSHRLIGKPGTSMQGWTYDWGRHAWIDNAPSTPPPAPQPAPRPQTQMRPRSLQLGPRPQLPVPQPQPQPPAPVPEKKEMMMEKQNENRQNTIDALIKHPIAPLIGAALLLAAQLTDEPAPPAIPQDLPEPIAKQWQMIFNQNQQRFQRRMELYENLGMVMLGYAGTNTILNALPSKRGT